MDIDDNVSHVEGSTTVMSAGESESESENELFEEAEIAETPYIQMAEDEFGAVSRFMALVGVDGRFMGLG